MLIDERRVLTCAHVVRSHPVEQGLCVSFAKAGTGVARRQVAEVIAVQSMPYQVADAVVLCLAEPAPPEAQPAPLRSPAGKDIVGEDWWAFGFPNQDPLGSAAGGTVGASLAMGWVRLDTGSRYLVEPGFSGGGLWSAQYGAVVGLVGQAQQGGDRAGDGRALTVHQITQLLPDQRLDDLTRWTPAASGESALAAWGWTLATDPEAGRHWRPRARGVAVDSEAGFRFRGRTAALTEIVSWIERTEPDRRVLVVTGSPGVGKSAVLGRIVTTADPAIRASLPPDDAGVRATPGSISCAVHTKGKTALEAAREVARAASARIPDQVDDLAPALREALTEQTDRPDRFTLIVDALDEATSPAEARAIVTHVALPLAQTCASVGVRVIVGSRRHDGGGDLLASFAGSITVIDLDSPAYFTAADIYEYALATLRLIGDERTGNPYADPEAARPLAKRIAALAERNFLVAGLVARSHGLHDTYPVAPATVSFAATVEDALRRYLDRISPIGVISARNALTVLAFAQAPGLPVTLWRQALTAWDMSVSESDLIDFAHSAAGNFIVETGTDPAGVHYRLFHQALNDVLRAARSRRRAPIDDERDLVTTWIQVGRDGGWDRAPEYLLRSLPTHAVEAKMIDALLIDDEFLLFADLLRLTPLAGNATSPLGRDRARMLRFTPHAVSASAGERAAMFNLTSALENLPEVYPVIPQSRYRTRWARCRPRAEYVTLTGHAGRVTGVCAVRLEGTDLLASASYDKTVRLWDPATGGEVRTLAGHTDRVAGVCAVRVDGRDLLASASWDKTVRVWDPATGANIRILAGHTRAVVAVCAMLVDQRDLLVSASDDKTVRVWDPAKGEEVRTLTGHTNRVAGICAIWISEQHLLATASEDTTVRLWDLATATEVRTLTGHSGAVTGITPVRVDGRDLLATASTSQTVRVWDPATGAEVRTLIGHTHRVFGVCAVRVDRRHLLATASDDQTVRVWDPAAGAEARTASGQASKVSGVCGVRTDGQLFVAAIDNEGVVQVLEAAVGAEIRTLTDRAVGMCVVKLNGRDLLATATEEGTVRLWDPTTANVTATLADAFPSKYYRWLSGALRVCVVRVGRLDLLAIATGQSVQLRDPATGATVRTIVGPTFASWAGALMCTVRIDGKDFIALARSDRTVWVCDPADGTKVKFLTGHTDYIAGVCSVRVGERDLLATVSRDKTARLWDLATGTEVRAMTGHTHAVVAICAVRMGGRELLATASEDRTVRVWDPATGSALVKIHVHHTAFNCASVANLLVVGTEAGLMAVELTLGQRHD